MVFKHNSKTLEDLFRNPKVVCHLCLKSEPEGISLKIYLVTLVKKARSATYKGEEFLCRASYYGPFEGIRVMVCLVG